MDKANLGEVLKKYWGYDHFRPSQAEAVRAVLDGKDTLVLMPTGGGKSLLYQLPAIVSQGVCVVVTPLVSLMKDQTDRLRKLGINAAAIHSGLTTRQIDLTLDNCTWGDVKLLYVSPERLTGSTFRTRFRGMNVSLIAVDEAHCISQWGYDFRPSYLRIADLRDINPEVPVLALTASATEKVAGDIMDKLRFREAKIIKTGFGRPNISFAVRHTDDKQGQLERVIRNVGGSGIVYARTRESTETLARWLTEKGLQAGAYHAGISAGERSRIQDAWRTGHLQTIVATNAFGMGIDKGDVRFVVHYDICDSPEAYYQEAGRAGRDGRRSYAVLLTSSDDQGRIRTRFSTEFPPIEEVRKIYEALFNYLQIGIGEGKYASIEFNLNEFSSRARLYPARAQNAIKILQQNGYMSLSAETQNPPRIMFTVGRDDLYKIRIEREELDHIIRTLLRLYTGLFHNRLVAVDIEEISRASGYTHERIMELLQVLWKMRIIRFRPGNRSPVLFLEEERLPPADLYISAESYEIRKQQASQRIEAMIRYASDNNTCRQKLLCEYFGDTGSADCGVCDVCLEKKKSADTSPSCDRRLEESIREQLLSGPTTAQEISRAIPQPPEFIARILQAMMDDGTVLAGDDGKLTLK